MDMFTTSNCFYSILPFKVKISLKCMNGWLPTYSNWYVARIQETYGIRTTIYKLCTLVPSTNRQYYVYIMCDYVFQYAKHHYRRPISHQTRLFSSIVKVLTSVFSIEFSDICFSNKQTKHVKEMIALHLG